MIIMSVTATKQQVDSVIKELDKCGLDAVTTTSTNRAVVFPVGDESHTDLSHLLSFPGVKEVMVVEAPYRLINRELHERLGWHLDYKVRVRDLEFGGSKPIYIAGPCAVESKFQILRTARAVKAAGASVLRGGVFKPRTSVHAFQGLGNTGEAEEALFWLRVAGDDTGMSVVSEVRGESNVNLVAKYADILQIGSRNMYNQDLLTRVAKTGKPILLKRHFGASIEEFLSLAEYIAAQGNINIILCERGVVPVGKGKSFTRYLLDIGAVPVIQKETFLPVIVDPSHAAGRRDLIKSFSYAAIAAGASGLMIESCPSPAEARVDGQQQITPDELKDLIITCNGISQDVREV